MTIRRYIFIGIPVACIIAVIVSIILYQPGRQTKNRKEITSPTKSALELKQLDNTGGKDSVTQTVGGLTMPSYDESGKEVVVMRGENTILMSDNTYKIISPEIEVMDYSNSENGTQSVLIKSESGEMDSTTNEGYLSDNVVIHFDPETQLNTEYLRYSPEKKFVYTDDPVTINGKGIKIIGLGCEIDLVNKKMWIKKDAEMEMDGVKNDLFFLSGENNQSVEENSTPLNETETTKEGIPEKTFIRSSGQLLFDRQSDAKIMTFNDNVEARKGSSTVFSDKLTIFLDPQTKQTKQAIASGNVLASQGTKIAKGSFLTWDVNTQCAILEDSQNAEFVKEDLNINAQKMILYKDTGKIDIPSPGSLKTKTNEKSGRKKAFGKSNTADNNINVKWEGKMNFLDDTREAFFEKGIEVKKDDSLLYCDKLNVTFNENDYNLQSMKAAQKIHIVDKKGSLYSEAVGDQVTWNAKNMVTVLTGKPFAMLREGNKRQILAPKILFYENSNNVLCEGSGTLYERRSDNKDAQDTDMKAIWSKKMQYNNTLKKISFYEGVQVTRSEQKLYGDQIDAYMNENQEINKIISIGNVYFYSKALNGSEGFGSLLTWDLIKNLALLTGNPKAELRKEGSRTFSQKVYFDIAQKRVSWEGRPHWQLISKETTDTN
ncbi:MAG: LPS export ABC transporter periplasmic protein LptC [Planctomycetes bacterium RIFCSPLOWO2_12_38_17]|nr:MAG: LPS export ABC transporter periplasmic protein LptC [Planctomycetes bacterium RIFCSPLOWO2_12_38_17]